MSTQNEELVVRNSDGSTTPLLDWLQSGRARVFLGLPPPRPVFSSGHIIAAGMICFLIGLMAGYLIFG